jgi:hypothetical protein
MYCSSRTNYIAGVFILFAVVHPGQHLPHEFLGWWLDTRRLRNRIQSSPPNYNQATNTHSIALATGPAQQA